MASTFLKTAPGRSAQRGGGTLVFATAAITGTGSIITGLSVLSGGPVVCPANSGASLPTDSAAVTSVAAGTVSVVVVNQAAGANSVEAAARNVNLIAAGS